ncbi:hypothetical protein [Lacipirellula sp.]|uniref:hypothetical protein n=1 Tax=Lacipirellula sp. TaxID=2691419 RepID=UPI003D13E734
MRIRLETKQTIAVDEAEWRMVWSGNSSAATGGFYSIWTAGIMQDRRGRSLIYVVQDANGGHSEAVGELGRPRAEDIAPILRRLCERASLDDFPESWEMPAIKATATAKAVG